MNPRKLEHRIRMIHAGIAYILYFKGMRQMMFQLSGFYCKRIRKRNPDTDPGFSKSGSSRSKELVGLGFTVGALIIRIGFWGPLYHDCSKEPKIVSPNSTGSQDLHKLGNPKPD